MGIALIRVEEEYEWQACRCKMHSVLAVGIDQSVMSSPSHATTRLTKYELSWVDMDGWNSILAGGIYVWCFHGHWK